MTNTQAKKLKKVLKHCNPACSCIVLVFYATSGSPSYFLPLVRQKAFKGFLLLLVVYFFENTAWFFLASVRNEFFCKATRASLSMLGWEELLRHYIAFGHLTPDNSWLNFTPSWSQLFFRLLSNCFDYVFHTQLFCKTLKVLGVRTVRACIACVKVIQPQAHSEHIAECFATNYKYR